MLKIGLTGGMGSGKSLIAEVFKVLKVPVFNSDLVSKNILMSNPEARKEVIENFGEAILSNDEIDRKKLAEVVFNDARKLEKLNAILHPKVGQYFEYWVQENQQADYVIKEAAILFESGAYKSVDKVICVSALEALRIKRVMRRDKIDKEAVESRLKKQWTDEEREKKSDFIIQNTTERLMPQILEIDSILRKF